MKTILVPTDFSENSDLAFQYAAALAKKTKAKIYLTHVVTVAIYPVDVPVSIPTEGELMQDAMKRLKEICENAKTINPGITIEPLVLAGYLEGAVADAVKNYKCDLVVMGTTGAGGAKEMLIGSNAALVIENCICPVIAVPAGHSTADIRKIVFAINYGQDDFENLFAITDLARLFESELILLHISQGKEDKALEYAELEGLASQIKTESQYPNISCKLLEDKDIYDGLNRYLESINADLLGISMRERNLLQRLFSRSLTKRMVYHTRIPLMAFHTSV